MEIGFGVIVFLFLIYYLAIVLVEKKIIHEPKEVLDKFLAVTLLYAGISIIYYSVTGKPFFGDNGESYKIYIFLIGLIAILWTVPVLLNEFKFFNRFLNKKKNINITKKRGKKKGKR
jgi:hypothetical protein